MNTSIQTYNSTLEKYSCETLINSFLSYIQELGGAAAIWRLPNLSEIHLLADLSGGMELKDFDLTELPSGFILAPFQENKATNLLFKSDIHFSYLNQSNPINC